MDVEDRACVFPLRLEVLPQVSYRRASFENWAWLAFVRPLKLP